MAAGQLAELVVEEVANNLEEAANVTRQLDTRAVGFFTGGMTFGLVVGFLFGMRFNKEKIKAEEFARSEAEIEKIRAVYAQKTTAAQPKPSVEDIVEEKGYVVVEEAPEPERPLRPVVPVDDYAGNQRRIDYAGVSVPFAKRTEDAEKSKDDGWNYPLELASRTPHRPYIIHQDEFHQNESGYQQVTYSYYAGDGVLTDERDDILENIDNLVGLENLQRWGHGSDDFNVIHIRNPVLELEFEVCRSPKSYEQEVQGLEHSERYGYNYERIKKRHRSDDEED